MRATGNLVLDALATPVKRLVFESAKHVVIPKGAYLYEEGFVPRHVYFVTEGVASIRSTTSSGHSGGLILSGRISAIGAEAMLGDCPMEAGCYFHTSGEALRMKMQEARNLLSLGYDAVAPISQSILCSLMMTQKTAICNSVHDAQQRLAQWCLMFSDISRSNRVRVTQQELADLLVVQRTTVSLVAGYLHEAGLIRMDRGMISILDRHGLEQKTCDCYATFRRLYPQVAGFSHSE